MKNEILKQKGKKELQWSDINQKLETLKNTQLEILQIKDGFVKKNFNSIDQIILTGQPLRVFMFQIQILKNCPQYCTKGQRHFLKERMIKKFGG